MMYVFYDWFLLKYKENDSKMGAEKMIYNLKSDAIK